MSAVILLIEDNENNRYLATYLLEAGGYKVVYALDGPSGISLANEMVPDLILLDIHLPGMDGYEVARELRQPGKLQRVLIIAVTSYAMVGDQEKVLAAGCNGYMEKPIDPDTFVSEIEEYLSRKRGQENG